MLSKSSVARSLAIFAFFLGGLTTPLAVNAKEKNEINQPTGEMLFATVGDNMVRVTLRESLPNAFGGSDIFGRKRERGFIELRYMGIAPDGRAIFRRRSVDVISNETTMSRSQSLFRGSTVSQSGSGANAAVVIEAPDGAGMEVLPPDTIEFALDLSKHRAITIEGYTIILESADPGGVSFQIAKRSR